MNREDPYRDQAERLRKKIIKTEVSPGNKLEEKESFPSRTRLHKGKKKKTKWKVKYPVIRLLALFFILMPITIFSMYNFLKNEKDGNAEKAATNQAGFETVGYEEKNKEKETKIEEREKGSESKTKVSEEKKKAQEEKAKVPADDKEENKDLAIPVSKSPTVVPSSDKGSVTPKKVSEKSAEVKERAQEGKQPDTETKEEEKQVIYHTVKPKETIYRIAMTYYQSSAGIEIIKEANNLQSNEIRVGQVLIIPKK